MESRGSETPAWGRAPGSSETPQTCMSVHLIFRICTRCLRGIRDPEEGSEGGPQEKQSWAARPLPHWWAPQTLPLHAALQGGTGALLSPPRWGQRG